MSKPNESTFPYFVNQCDMCNHKRYPDGGYCYMFRTVPMGPCGQHTVQTIKAMHTRAKSAFDTLQRMQSEQHYGMEPWGSIK